jgi:nucleoside-diphosphate-sugar epimerase
MPDKQKVLLTGFGGRIGRVIRNALGDRYEFSGIDIVDVPGEKCLKANLADLDAIQPAFEGVDSVIHLAAEPRHTPDIGWDILLPNNVIATANVFEAAHKAGAKRVIFFSSMHVNGLYERDEPYASIAAGKYDGIDPDTVPLVTHQMDPRPDAFYAVSKLFGENLGRYYADEFGMTVLCIRFGTTSPQDRPGSDPRSYVSFFSHRDIAAMVDRCVEVEGLGFDVFFGASANKWKIYDTPRAWKVLGFQPQDNAESYRA